VHQHGIRVAAADVAACIAAASRNENESNSHSHTDRHSLEHRIGQPHATSFTLSTGGLTGIMRIF